MCTYKNHEVSFEMCEVADIYDSAAAIPMA